MAASGSAAPGGGVDTAALLRSRAYLRLLVFAALLGVPVSAFAFGFLALTNKLEPVLYTDLPKALGFHEEPQWWPLPVLAAGGAAVALIIRRLPGRGGHEPTDGFAATGVLPAAALPGVFFAAVVTLASGAVLGPEAPLLALGGGLAVAAVRLVKPDLPAQAVAVIGATGSFAAVSSLLGSPLLGAFLLMEASGLGGPALGAVLVPGLLASGIGALIFVGFGSWTGLGTYSLTLHHVPAASGPTAAEFGWALVIGVAGALVASGVQWLALRLKSRVERDRTLRTTILGLLIAGLAIAYAHGSGHGSAEVLSSGQSALDPLLRDRGTYTVGALVLLVACKGLAYSASLSAFRGGPIFPAVFLGAAGGIALSHLPGLSLTAGFAAGIGAMTAAMLRLPLTSVLLATLLLGKPGLTVMPLVITAVVVSYVTTALLHPTASHPSDPPPAPGSGQPA